VTTKKIADDWDRNSVLAYMPEHYIVPGLHTPRQKASGRMRQPREGLVKRLEDCRRSSYNNFDLNNVSFLPDSN
jgi:hypothetical protein